MTLPSRAPSRRMLRCWFLLGALAGATLAAALLIRHLPTH